MVDHAAGGEGGRVGDVGAQAVAAEECGLRGGGVGFGRGVRGRLGRWWWGFWGDMRCVTERGGLVGSKRGNEWDGRRVVTCVGRWFGGGGGGGGGGDGGAGDFFASEGVLGWSGCHNGYAAHLVDFGEERSMGEAAAHR